MNDKIVRHKGECHTEKLHRTERLHADDLGRCGSIHDRRPGAYSKPSGEVHALLMPADEDCTKYICNETTQAFRIFKVGDLRETFLRIRL